MKKSDPLLKPNTEADRLHYATGELLGADDFRDEQTYHRRQLARALLFLHGSGSIAGLRVVARHLPGSDPSLDDVELEVEPGLALDRAGRLIEVPRPACLRVRRWYEFIENQPPDSDGLDVDDLRTAFDVDRVVADIYLTFHPCDRGTHRPSPADRSMRSTLRSHRACATPTSFRSCRASRIRRLLSTRGREFMTPPRHCGLKSRANSASTPGGCWQSRHQTHYPRRKTLPASIRLPCCSRALASRPRPAPDGDSAPVPNWSAGVWPDPTPPPPAPAEVTPNVDNTVRNFLLPPAALLHLLST